MYDENAGIEAKCRSKYELNPFFICRDSGSILDTIAREDLLLVLEDSGCGGSHGGTWCIFDHMIHQPWCHVCLHGSLHVSQPKLEIEKRIRF